MFSSSLHNPEVFVHDLVVAIKVYQGDLSNINYDQNFKFTNDNFWAFKSLLEFKSENIQLHYIYYFNFRVSHLAFELDVQQVLIVHWDLETMLPSMVTKDVFVIVESLVKNEYKGKPNNFFLYALHPIFTPIHIFFHGHASRKSMNCVYFDRGQRSYDSRSRNQVSDSQCHVCSWDCVLQL